jgi:hypothetical protein
MTRVPPAPLVLLVPLVVLAGLAPLVGPAPPALAQAGRPTGPTQGRVVGATYVNRAAGYAHRLPLSWIRHGYKWYEYWGPRAAGQRPAAAFVADWVYVPTDPAKPEATLLTIAVYPAEAWQSLAAQGGPPAGQPLAATGRWVYAWSGRQDAPYGDGSADDQQAAALYADVSLITASFRLLESAGRPLAGLPTQVAPFDPAALPPAPGPPARGAACGPSAAVPREGAYSCLPEGAAGVLDPCFALSGDALACTVNPATGSYTLVAATAPLPATSDAQAEAVPFYVELGADKPPCAKRGQPVAIGAYVAGYACQAPGAWLVGPLRTAGPVWIAQYATSDTQNATVTYGPEPTRVARAWVY